MSAVSGCFTTDVKGDPLRLCWWTLYRLKLGSTGYIFRRLCMPTCIVLGVVRCHSWQKSRQLRTKTRFVGSRSFKVTVFGTNRKGIC